MKPPKTMISYFTILVGLTACASTPAPQASVPQSVVPASVTSSPPAWFVEQPESTAEFAYVVGTAVSRDISMSGHKAQLDAETHLANKLAGGISTLTKDYKRDVGDEFAQSTEIATNKVATDVKIAGADVVKKQVTPEGGGFRTYVLLKFPLGSKTQVPPSHISNQNFKESQETAERELRQRTDERRSTSESPTISNASTVSPVVDNSGIVIRETLATETSGPLGLADKLEEN